MKKYRCEIYINIRAGFSEKKNLIFYSKSSKVGSVFSALEKQLLEIGFPRLKHGNVRIMIQRCRRERGRVIPVPYRG